MSDNVQGFTMEGVATLRTAYRPEALVAATRGALAQVYPPGVGFVGAVVDALYGPEPVKPVDRERSLIALLGARQERMNLGIHIYWGLMEGLTLGEVGHTLLLVGAYTGIPAYATSMVVLQKTAAILKAAAEGPVEGQSPLAVVQRLMVALA